VPRAHRLRLGPRSAAPSRPEDRFGVRWSADLTLGEGTYRFAASTDDGTRVYLDGERIIDVWYPRRVTETAAYGYVPRGGTASSWSTSS
jgi:hypothetical protein